ncbi:MAG: hypothetical protein U9Q69_01210 [Nanoarchaeota archaeon]|nr:hypothetical protein [Nanoarchaeota archaeon]
MLKTTIDKENLETWLRLFNDAGRFNCSKLLEDFFGDHIIDEEWHKNLRSYMALIVNPNFSTIAQGALLDAYHDIAKIAY